MKPPARIARKRMSKERRRKSPICNKKEEHEKRDEKRAMVASRSPKRQSKPKSRICPEHILKSNK